MPKASRQPDGTAAGPDGAMWFTQCQGNAIGRIAMDGSITEYSVPTAAAGPYLITEGPDGVMWFTEFQGEKIGRITMIGGHHRVLDSEYRRGPSGNCGGH